MGSSVVLGLAVLAVGLALVGWRVEAGLRALAAQRIKLQARELALAERRLALEEQRQAANEDMPAMPLDLVMRCNNETETWAREQMRSVVQQLWGKHRNWDGVRTEMAAMDAAALASEMGWSQTRQVS